MANRFITPAPLLDKLGATVPGGQLFFYEIGTTTPKDTFSDQSATPGQENTNPVILDAAGVQPDIFGDGEYRVVFKTANTLESPLGVQLWERDPVDFFGSSSLVSVYDDWLVGTTYDLGDRVTGSNDLPYRSLSGLNTGNDPTVSPTQWSRLADTTLWNANENYPVGASAIGSNGRLYVSTSATNTGNDPTTDNYVRWQESFSGCLAYLNSTTQTIPDDVATAIGMDGEVYDTQSYHSNVTNNSRLTAPVDGRYKIDFQSRFTPPATTTGYLLSEARMNGVATGVPTPQSSQELVNSASGTTSINGSSAVLSLSAGDYIELFVYQITGAPMDVRGTNTNRYTWISMELVS